MTDEPTELKSIYQEFDKWVERMGLTESFSGEMRHWLKYAFHRGVVFYNVRELNERRKKIK